MKKLVPLLVAVFIYVTSYSQTEEQLSHLDNYYSKSQVEWNIPGMAVAIVNRDSIVFSKGYGFANLKSKTKVDGNTLFSIASNTKAFIATALAKLVEQGKLSRIEIWEDDSELHSNINNLALCLL